MFVSSKLADFFLRFAAGILIGMLFGYGLSQASYVFSPDKESVQRSPQEVQLVIPYGTAAEIRQGGANPQIPQSMSFVQGDVLIVRNEDTVAHQLGPLFVPPGTASALSLDSANDYNYTCTFTPTQYLGLNVLPRVTAGLQFQAVLAIGLPTGMMLGIYSYLLPGRKKTAGAGGKASPAP